MADKTKRRREDKRFFFRNPKQEKKTLIFNLSSRGALFARTEPIEVGEQLILEMTLPKGMATLTLPGKARWVKRVGEGDQSLYLIGMQFEKQDEMTHGVLEAYIQYLHRDRLIQKSRAIALANLEELNRTVTVELLRKEGLPEYSQ